MSSQEESIRCAILCRPVIETDSSTSKLLPIHPNGSNFSLQLGEERIIPHSLYADGAIPIENLAENEIKPQLQAALRGESAAIITVGATGAGKSFFIGTGKPNPKSAAHYVGANLWKLAEEQGIPTSLDVKLSFLEIIGEGGNAKERVYDLFAKADINQKRQPIPSTRPPWELCTWVKISDQASLLRDIKNGAKRRTTDSNGINDTSSRSHAIIAVKLQYNDTNGSTVSAKVLLVDLAGNEDACAAEKGFTPVPKHQSRHIPSTTPVKDITRAQGRGINVGLFHLHQLIASLASGKQPTSNLFKSSKLTELLEPALGGKNNVGIMSKGCRTLMVGCISPVAVDAKRSMRTLKFIEAAGAVKIKVVADIMLSTSRQAEVDILKQKLKHAEEQVEKVRQEKEQEKDLEKARQAELHAGEIQELKAQLDAMQATCEKLRASENPSLQPPPPTELDFSDDTDTASPFPDMYMDDTTTSKEAEDVIDLTFEEPDSDNNASKAALGERRTPGFENTPSSQVLSTPPPPMSRQKTSTPQSKSTKRRLQPPGGSRFGAIEGIVLSSCKKRQKKIPSDLGEYLERNAHWRAGQQLQQLLGTRKETPARK